MKENMLTRNWVYDIIKVLKVSICGWLLNIFWMFLYFSLFGGPERSSTLQLKKTPGNRKTLQKIKKKKITNTTEVFLLTQKCDRTPAKVTQMNPPLHFSLSQLQSLHIFCHFSHWPALLLCPQELYYFAVSFFFFFFWLKKSFCCVLGAFAGQVHLSSRGHRISRSVNFKCFMHLKHLEKSTCNNTGGMGDQNFIKLNQAHPH